MKRFSLPLSQVNLIINHQPIYISVYLFKNTFFYIFIDLLEKILLFESSNRFGGWLKSDRFIDNDLKSRNIMFEGGPRTIRIASGEVKELNTLQLVS